MQQQQQQRGLFFKKASEKQNNFPLNADILSLSRSEHSRAEYREVDDDDRSFVALSLFACCWNAKSLTPSSFMGSFLPSYVIGKYISYHSDFPWNRHSDHSTVRQSHLMLARL